MTHDQQGAVPPFTSGAATPGQAPPGQPPYGQNPGPPAYGQTSPGQVPYGQAPPGPPAYGQTPGQVPYGQTPGTDGMSTAALVTGILGLGAVPLALGIVGLKRTKANGTSGRGFALAGIILGSISLVVGLVLVSLMLVGGLAILQAEEERAGAVGSGPVLVDPTAPSDEIPDDTTDTTDENLAWSETPLLDYVPLTVEAFTSAGLVEEASVLDAGALEAYTTTYTDGTDTVLTYVTDWSTAEEASVFASAVGSAFQPEQLIDSGIASEDGFAKYWLYDFDGASTIVATNDTVALTMTGPSDAVHALYLAFPL